MIVHNISKPPRYLRERYKTKEGAEKRARFENMHRQSMRYWYTAELTLEGDAIVYRVQKRRIA